MRHRRFAASCIVIASTGLVACADPEEQSLCTVYADAVMSVTALRDVGQSDVTAGEADDAVEAAIADVKHLAAVSDQRYVDQIGGLETALEDLHRVLTSVREDEDASVWKPLVEDSAEDVRTAASVVANEIDPSCQPTT